MFQLFLIQHNCIIWNILNETEVNSVMRLLCNKKRVTVGRYKYRNTGVTNESKTML